jgi:hypothetical protein
MEDNQVAKTTTFHVRSMLSPFRGATNRVARVARRPSPRRASGTRCRGASLRTPARRLAARGARGPRERLLLVGRRLRRFTAAVMPWRAAKPRVPRNPAPGLLDARRGNPCCACRAGRETPAGAPTGRTSRPAGRERPRLRLSCEATIRALKARSGLILAFKREAALRHCSRHTSARVLLRHHSGSPPPFSSYPPPRPLPPPQQPAASSTTTAAAVAC